MRKKENRRQKINKIAAIDKIKLVSKETIKNCNTLITNWSFAKKPFFILVIIYTIAFSAIFRANFNYIDDMGRAYAGYKEWNNFSRYTSYYLSTVIHGNNYLTDVSPFPQFISILFLSLSSIILIYVINGTKKITLGEIIATLPLGLCPFFLECISYKFDSPYMALSILASIFPLLFYKKVLPFSCAIFISTLIMCTTYQAASGIFPMLVVLLCFNHWNEGSPWKEVGKFFCASVFSYGFAILFFQQFIMKPATSYASNSLPALQNMPFTVYGHFKKYFYIIYKSFNKSWIFLIFLSIFLFIFISVKYSKKNKIISLLLSFGTALIMLLLSFGLYAFLEKPLFAPRSMYGFGILIALFGVANSSSNKKNYCAKIVCLVLGWLFFVFSFTYGNALSTQKEYADFRTEMIINTMNELPIFSTEETKKVQLTGSVGYAPAVENAISHYPILSNLVPINCSGPWWWGYYKFANYYKLKNIAVVTDLGIDYELPVLTDTMYFTIRGDNQYILIELK